jgi:hypothetical protein
MACEEATEACLESKEPTSMEVEHEEVPKEDAAVETSGALKKWHRERHLAVRRHGQPKKQTPGYGGSWKKLAATCRGMTHHAIPARYKGQGKDSVAQGAQKEWTFGRRHTCQETIIEIKNQGSRQQLV